MNDGLPGATPRTLTALADGSVTAAKLATDAVTTIKILDANVTTAKLADDAVTTAKILNANVTTAKLAAQSVTDAKRAPHTFSAKTGASYSLLTTDHDQSFTNQGASGTVPFTLPGPAAGLRYRIYRRTNQSINLVAAGANIDDGTTTGTVYTITSATGHVEVECDGTNWIVIGHSGTYTLA